jgi:heme exporter protein A
LKIGNSVRVSNLSCRRGGRLVLANLSFMLSPGQCLLVRGPNGVGKSSLLRVLAGLLDYEQGEIEQVQDVLFIGHENALKREELLVQHMTFWAELYAIPKNQRAAQVAAALQAMALQTLADLPIRLLSQGQKRRASLARLALRPVATWLLDEPTVGLDDASCTLLTALMQRHLARGGCLVAATHQDLSLPNAQVLELQPLACPSGTADAQDCL